MRVMFIYLPRSTPTFQLRWSSSLVNTSLNTSIEGRVQSVVTAPLETAALLTIDY